MTHRSVPPFAKEANVGPSLSQGTHHGYRARNPQGRPRQRLLVLSALALRLLRQPHANAVTGSPNRFRERNRYISPRWGSSGCPSGNLFLFPPSTRAGPNGSSRWSVPLSRPWRRRLRFATLRSGSARCARSTSTPVAYARRRRNPAAGRLTLPAASQPSLTLGHPARPPEGQLFLFLPRFLFF